MPRTLPNIETLLAELDTAPADAMEDQDLDFKEWPERSREKAVDQVVEMAVCMANGGGGTVVFGVRDRVVGRAGALLGVPAEIDINLLLKAVYDRTDPRLTPVFEELMVPEGTGRLLLMQVYGGLPPYTDSQGRAKVRVGKDCLPLTGSLRAVCWSRPGSPISPPVRLTAARRTCSRPPPWSTCAMRRAGRTPRGPAAPLRPGPAPRWPAVLRRSLPGRTPRRPAPLPAALCLLGHPELDTATAASLCQRTEPEARDLLNDMETGLGYLERGGTGRGTYWALRPDLHRQLAGPGHPERDRRIAWEAAKTRILSVLKDRARRGGPGLSNQEIRQITHYDRNQVVRLMLELRAETPEILLDGAGRSACYRLDPARK